MLAHRNRDDRVHQMSRALTMQIENGKCPLVKGAREMTCTRLRINMHCTCDMHTFTHKHALHMRHAHAYT